MLYFSTTATLIFMSAVSCCLCLSSSFFSFQSTLKSNFLTSVFFSAPCSVLNTPLVTPLLLPACLCVILRFLMVSSFTSSTPCKTKKRHTWSFVTVSLKINGADPSENYEISSLCCLQPLFSITFMTTRVFLFSYLLFVILHAL